MNKPILTNIIYKFIQEGNTDGTTDETEELIVELEGAIDILTDGAYMVLRTSTGWSINDKEELIELIDFVNKYIPYDKKEDSK